MDLTKWVELMKVDFEGKPPQVFYDEHEENYWVGYKSHGGALETPLARGMMQSTAEFLRDKVAELF